MSKNPSIRRAGLAAVALTVLVGFGVLGHRSAMSAKKDYDYYLPSTPENMYFGWFPRDAPPALTVPSGSIVRIDTISQRGVGGSGMDPVGYLGTFEMSNTLTAQFIVHKGGGLTIPRAETPTHFILMGIDIDHDVAYQGALAEVLAFLQSQKGMSLADARAFASLAVDFNIAESVDLTQLVMGRIPKRMFTEDFKVKDFWHKPLNKFSEGQRNGLDGFH